MGIMIGGMWTGNKLFWIIMIIYTVVMVIVSLIGNRIVKIKEAADKKLELRNQGISALNDYIMYVEKSIVYANYLFDRYYPMYTMMLCISGLVGVVWLLHKHYYLYALIGFIGLNTFIVINNIWRKVKNLKDEVSKDVKVGSMEQNESASA